ncbi:MAG: response regulator [Gammaproteobacteria bacterium]
MFWQRNDHRRDGLNVLVIDDSPFILRMIEQGLAAQFADCRVHTINPLDSDGVFPASLKPFDLIVLGLNLGHLGDGIDWFLKKAAPASLPPVILISASDPANMARRVEQAGFFDWMEKDTDLVPNLARWLRPLMASRAA